MTTAAPAASLTRSLRPVAAGFTLVHGVFLMGVFIVRTDAELPAVSSVRSGMDAFGVFLFVVVTPLLLEMLLVGVPLACLLNQLPQRPALAVAYLGASGLCLLYFFFAASLYGTEPAAYKTGLIGVVIALLLRWRRLSDETDDE